MHSRATAYKKVQVATNDRWGILLMVHDGIIKELKRARLCLRSELRGAELAVLKAQAGIVELDKTLNFDNGPDLANSLHDLYLHILLSLSEVLDKGDVGELERVLDLVERLRQTWFEASKLKSCGGPV